MPCGSAELEECPLKLKDRRACLMSPESEEDPSFLEGNLLLRPEDSPCLAGNLLRLPEDASSLGRSSRFSECRYLLSQ